MSPFTRKRRTSGGRRSRQRGEAGFTLLEVLVAFAILAVMLIPILQVFGGGLGVTGAARGYAEAALLARSKLAELTAQKLAEGEASGSFDDRGYRWQASVTADDSDVTLPDNTVVGLPVRPGQKQRRRAGGAASTAEHRSSFGDAHSSGSSPRRSLFGQSRSGFGEASRSAASPPHSGLSGSGASGSGASGSGFSGSGSSHSAPSFGSSGAQSSAQPGLGGGEEEEGEVVQFIPYRVAVTVEWGDAYSGGGAVTLTTLRLVQPEAPGEPGAEPEGQ